MEVAPRRPHPHSYFIDAAGKTWHFADFMGKGLLVNLWATWCPPCVAEMPALDAAQAALAPEGIMVLPLSSDRGGKEQVEQFYQAHGIRNLGLWLDPGGQTARAFKVPGLPTTLVIDRNGMERARLVGAAAWNRPEMLRQIRGIIGPAGQSQGAGTQPA